MNIGALIFVGLGSIAECSEIDRQAWNAAFRAHGMRWDWSWDAYAELMRPGGDRQLAARYAAFVGAEVDAEKLDAAHIRSFAARMNGEMPVRNGVAELLRWAARRKLSLALVSRAAPAVAHAVLSATARTRAGIEFDAIVTRDHVDRLAPHPDGVLLAQQQLGVPPQSCVAIADTPAGAAAALDAGLATCAFPGLLAEDQVFPEGVVTLGSMALNDVMAALGLSAQTAAE
ncbi:MAG: HAD-IA family hydrolase [Pseudomonadota bacterium]